jgi:Zn-dependent M28 family amino/carboxypeptidase
VVDYSRVIFGGAEPRLRPLDPVRASRLLALRSLVDESRLRSTLERLPAPRVRAQTPERSASVDQFAWDAFAAAGWSTSFDSFRIQVEDAWADAENPDHAVTDVNLEGVNIVAVNEGDVPDAVVVLAHHDTVPGTGGADDNGSGLVAVLELARLLGPARLHRSVVLACVDHEELGFLGARRLVGQLTGQRPIVGAYVFEMLAYTCSTPGSQTLPPGIGLLYPGQVRRIRSNGLRGDFTAVVYRQPGRALAVAFAEALTHLAGRHATVVLRDPTDLPVLGPVLERTVPFAREFGRSDHIPFWAAGLPAVQITDTADFRNPHYHQPSDLPDSLDIGRLADVVASTALAVERIAGSRAP